MIFAKLFSKHKKRREEKVMANKKFYIKAQTYKKNELIDGILKDYEPDSFEAITKEVIGKKLKNRGIKFEEFDVGYFKKILFQVHTGEITNQNASKIFGFSDRSDFRNIIYKIYILSDGRFDYRSPAVIESNEKVGLPIDTQAWKDNLHKK